MSTHQNILGHTLDQLGEAIVSGRYAPGSAIPPEPVLGEAFGVSRTVVREAIKSLVAKGLVVTGPKVGTRVLPAEQWNWFDPDVITWQAHAGLTPEFLRDLQELRRVVEPAAVRLAAEKAKQDHDHDRSEAVDRIKAEFPNRVPDDANLSRHARAAKNIRFQPKGFSR